jgi:thiol-disulfide isomerase/thioredoxin
VIGLVLAVVAVVAIVAVLAAGGGDDEASSTTITAVPGETAAPGAVEQLRPVVVEGDALAPLEDPASDPAVGTTPPTLRGQSFDGTPVEIVPGEGGPTMVVFLAHWCPHCNDEIPRLLQLQEEGRLPDGLQVVAVSTAVTPERPNFPPSEWLAGKGWTWPAMADEADPERQVYVASDAYGVSGFPFVTVIGEDGTVTARWSGESDVDELEDKINAAVGA